MKKFIEDHDDEEKKIMSEFLDLRGESEAAKEAMADPATYGEMKAWFFKKFPQIEEFHENRAALLAA